jgi:hypothetical protein
MEHSIEFRYKQDDTCGHRVFWREILDESRSDLTTADVPVHVWREGKLVLQSDVAAIVEAAPISELTPPLTEIDALAEFGDTER